VGFFYSDIWYLIIGIGSLSLAKKGNKFLVHFLYFFKGKKGVENS
jgi:hypothetical protein